LERSQIPLIDQPAWGASAINHVNLADAMNDYLKTRSGERATLNIIQRNPGTAGG
jgi:hypothetical protein